MLPQVAFNDLDPESQARWAMEMSHTSAAFFSAPSCVEPWNDGVPCAYIHNELDNALPLCIQRQMAEQLGPCSVTESIKAGHCPHLSMPNELAATVQGIESQLCNLHEILVSILCSLLKRFCSVIGRSNPIHCLGVEFRGFWLGILNDWNALEFLIAQQGSIRSYCSQELP